jgi:glyoxylase-like metal-dependent hydrolase (beta-lactamase superfamily II)
MSSTSRSTQPTGLVVDNIYSINNDFVSWYLIKSKSGYIAIDAGADNDKSVAALSQLGIDPKDIIAVILTHDHWDHTASLDLFRGVPIYGKSKDYVTDIVHDGQVLEIDGIELTIVDSIGHKWDHICVVVDKQYLFVADSMSLYGDKVTIFVSKYNDSNDMQAKDIIKLSKIPNIKYTITHHFGYTATPDYSDFV